VTLRNRVCKILKLFWIYLPFVISCFGIYIPQLCSWTFFSWDISRRASSIYIYFFQVISFLPVSLPTSHMHFLSPSHVVLYTPILLLILVHLISQLMVGEEYNHESPCYVVFSSFLLLSLYEAPISLPAPPPHFWTPWAWACFPPIMWETKYHTHNRQIYVSVYINLYILK